MIRIHTMARLIGVALSVAGTSIGAQRAPTLPIIDVHLHAEHVADYGPTPMVCSDNRALAWNGWDPRNPLNLADVGVCKAAFWRAPSTDSALVQSTVAMLRRYNIRAITTGTPEDLAVWRAAAPTRILPAVNFFLPGRDAQGKPLYRDTAELRRLVRQGDVKVFAEITAQYRGMSPADPALEPYFALAEELDIPVGMHMGEGPPGGPNVEGYSQYRVRLGDPLLLEEVLARHPKLRVYVMHYGSPFIDNMMALMFSYPQVYVDVAQNNWGFPRTLFHQQLKRLVDAGFAKRILFGSDQMVWPQTIGLAIETIESAKFLSAQQKRDIFYNNAVRFFRLDDRASGSRDAPAETSTVAARTVRVTHNPLIADSLHYTADPAPLVVDNQLYIITGRDVARSNQNDFVMPEWQLLSTRDDPLNGSWRHVPHLLRPERVFAWATPGRAYAAQIVRGVDQRFYLYAPVIESASTSRDKFAIGVAVAPSPDGPWQDAHPSGPILSQRVPVANSIQNIDPTVLVDGGRVFVYWGTFGKLKGLELAADMVTPIGTPTDITTLTGFFEAPWLFKRGDTYYLAYAANNAGPTSSCTEAVYYACIAYGSAPSPLGPWTYRGVILPPVSSTTSHPGIVAYRGAWWIVYHTADAPGGGHFRRSVAIDQLTWNDATSPATIRPVVRTGAATPPRAPRNNIAPDATLSASNEPVPVQYWLRALNDGLVRENPLPPDMWATWTPNNPSQQWVQYTWREPVTISASAFNFWVDHPAGSGVGVAPPRAWHLEWCNNGTRVPVQATSPYSSTPNTMNRVTFVPITTTCLRAVFDASTNGSTFAAVAGQEWTVERDGPSR